jgi:hypothetical protein
MLNIEGAGVGRSEVVRGTGVGGKAFSLGWR